MAVSVVLGQRVITTTDLGCKVGGFLREDSRRAVQLAEDVIQHGAIGHLCEDVDVVLT